MDVRIEKWDRIYSQQAFESVSAAQVLTENAYLLPDGAIALDLACGLGGNAIFLARQGLQVKAWDISGIAIDKLAAYSVREKLHISASQQNITKQLFTESVFDVIVISRFLDRTLSDAIIAALKPGGLLFYQTYTREKTDGTGPDNPEFLLARNELLRLFSPLTVVFYRENSRCGNVRQGLRNEAQFVGQKINGLTK